MKQINLVRSPTFDSNLPSFTAPDISIDSLWHRVFSLGSGDCPSASPQRPSLQEPQWVHIDAKGNITTLGIDRHYLVHTLKLRYRDLAAIDPTLPLPTPTVILVRGRSIALNLDVGGCIRMIICENQCFVLSVPKDKDPQVTALPTENHPFVQRLARCLRPPPKGVASSSRLLLFDNTDDVTMTQEEDEQLQQLQQPSIRTLTTTSHVDVENMPYELKAFEVALTAALGILTNEVSDFEEWAFPAIDRLLHKVNRETLEAVRTVKNVADKLQVKVQELVEELKELLEDDEDMADLYLERKATERGWVPLGQPWEEPRGDDDVYDDGTDGTDNGDNGKLLMKGTPTRARTRRRRGRKKQRRKEEAQKQLRTKTTRTRRVEYGDDEVEEEYDDDEEEEDNEDDDNEDGTGSSDWDSEAASEALETEEEEHMTAIKSPQNRGGIGRRRKGQTHQPGSIGRVNPHDIEEAEDLLETFYEKGDLLLRRLVFVDEKIDATEDLLELELDERRNNLVAVGVMTATVSMAFSWAAAVGGFWGMNLYNTQVQETAWVLIVVAVVMVIGAVALIALVVWYVRLKRLMFIPSTSSF